MPEASFFTFPLTVLSIDRMENHTHLRRRYPRYHSTLFRGQAMWDPHTHIILPHSILTPHKIEGKRQFFINSPRPGSKKTPNLKEIASFFLSFPKFALETLFSFLLSFFCCSLRYAIEERKCKVEGFHVSFGHQE